MLKTIAWAVGLVGWMGCSGIDGGSSEQPAGSLGKERAALTPEASQVLFITAPWVVGDPSRTSEPCSAVSSDVNKAWTIGHMLSKEASKATPPVSATTYVTNWMNAWNTTVTINGQTVPPLKGRDVLRVWQRFSGSTALPLHKAPFNLRAIVNRIDLREQRPFGEPLGGEIRFIFGIYDPDPNGAACPIPEFGMDPNSTIILEYSTNKADENQVRNLASRWLNLRNLSGNAYLAALQTLTEEVVNSGKLLHIRTNEFPTTAGAQPEPDGWNMLEFEPDSSGVLRRSTVKQSPTMALDSGTSPLLGNYIWSNRGALFANAFDFEVASTTMWDPIGTYVVPNKFSGTNTWFRGSINEMGIANTDDFWNAPTPSGADGLTFLQARFRFSIGTCRGCHGRETATGFNHLFPGQVGQEAFISSFVAGETEVEDPILPGWVRTFDEMGRRTNDLHALVNGEPVRLPVFGNNYTLRFLVGAGDKCLDSVGNTTTEGAFSQLYTCHGNANQRLSLVSVGTQVYSLKYKHSGKCIDVQNGSTSNGARVVQATCNASRASQRLTLLSSDSRLVRFQHSNLCLLVQNQATTNGTPIVQGTCPTSNGSAGFQLVE